MTSVGMKRPITVMPCRSRTPDKDYDLICGQGRLEAFMACGQKMIPAIIMDVDEEQALVMSLVENLARRQHRSLDLLRSIEVLQNQGYTSKQIAEKTGLTPEYIQSVLRLLANGEERLLSAVESGGIPLHLAIKISENPGDEQRVLEELYASEQLRGKKLLVAKKLLDLRKKFGKSFSPTRRTKGGSDRPISVQDVLKIYRKDVDRKRMLTRKAEVVNQHLLFVTEAFRQLLKDENFTNLLRAEGIKTLPKPLHHLMNEKGAMHG
jgi:ParB family chromosome partitioning protein